MHAALSDPVCSTPNIYTHHRNFTWTSCPFSIKMGGEKIAAQRMCTVFFVSMWSASSAESSADTCWKKLQCVALAYRVPFTSYKNRKPTFGSLLVRSIRKLHLDAQLAFTCKILTFSGCKRVPVYFTRKSQETIFVGNFTESIFWRKMFFSQKKNAKNWFLVGSSPL